MLLVTCGSVVVVPGSLVSSRSHTYRGVLLSSPAQTHSLHKLQSPSRCVECDHYVYFQGAECDQVTQCSCRVLLPDSTLSFIVYLLLHDLQLDLRVRSYKSTQVRLGLTSQVKSVFVGAMCSEILSE